MGVGWVGFVIPMGGGGSVFLLAAVAVTGVVWGWFVEWAVAWDAIGFVV